MPAQILQPLAGSTVTSPVLVEWVYDEAIPVHGYKFGQSTSVIPLSEGTNYTCEYTCYAWLETTRIGTESIRLWYNENGSNYATSHNYFTVSGVDNNGGGQTVTPDPNTDPDPDTGTNTGDFTEVVAELQNLNEKQETTEAQIDYVGTLIVVTAAMFAIFKGYQAGVTR